MAYVQEATTAGGFLTRSVGPDDFFTREELTEE